MLNEGRINTSWPIGVEECICIHKGSQLEQKPLLVAMALTSFFTFFGKLGHLKLDVCCQWNHVPHEMKVLICPLAFPSAFPKCIDQCSFTRFCACFLWSQVKIIYKFKELRSTENSLEKKWSQAWFNRVAQRKI